MHGRSTIGGNFGRGSWSDIGKFRSKLPRELIVGRRGEEGEEDRRSFLYEEDLTWFDVCRVNCNARKYSMDIVFAGNANFASGVARDDFS